MARLHVVNQTSLLKKIEIAYEVFGERSARPLILIAGLASQMVDWPTRFCGMLAAAGHYVIRFDNRDAGLSTKLNQYASPNIKNPVEAFQTGAHINSPYTLEDMAADTINLMDTLDLKQAHICGMSMGGMIAQIMALKYPMRILSLTSMMSTTGERKLTPQNLEAHLAMMPMSAGNRTDYLDYSVRMGRFFSGGSAYYDSVMQHSIAGQAFDRGLDSNGFLRQLSATLAARPRNQALANIHIPTQVIHGTTDNAVSPVHAVDMVRAIPDAKLLMIQGLGHGMAYPSLWEAIVCAITRHTASAII
ncbi:MAG: alpha/beta hydrolase [Desulfobacteraceae bacterium]|nr:alpha/beta hydrolase [Desulfobacteraceae bacterium]